MEHRQEERIEIALRRIGCMEALYEAGLNLPEQDPGQEATAEAKALMATLSDYLDSGLWLEDYRLDEEGLLPKELKRGVLSQDGLYDLLTAWRERQQI